MSRRRPGQSLLTTARDESDKVKLLSGIENGITLGTPIALFIPNENIRPQDYYQLASVPRPGLRTVYMYFIYHFVNLIVKVMLISHIKRSTGYVHRAVEVDQVPVKRVHE